MTRILLADDQPEVRSALRLLLEVEPGKWTVVGEAPEAQELREALNTARCDLVLLDWELPGMHLDKACKDKDVGYTFAVLREKYPALVIVVMSGRSEARKEALEAGAQEFVSKGDPPEKLLAVLHRVSDSTSISPIQD